MAKRGPGCVRVLILVVLAPILFGLGLLLISNLNRVLTHETTDAVIVDLLYSTDSDGDPSYTPVYQYVVDGQTFQYEGAVSFGGALIPSLGDTRKILYDPSDPNDARVRNIFLLIWLPILLMFIPVLIAIGVLWGIRRRLRIQDQAPPWADQAQPNQPSGTPDATLPPWNLPDAASRDVIEATFMGTEPSQMDSKGDVRYRVKARAEINGELIRFRSEWMDDDPTLYYMQHGNKVEVRIEPGNPSRYEVVLPDPG